MKIIYPFNWAGHPSSGVATKVLNQIDAWRTFGVKCELYVICPIQFKFEWHSKTNHVYSYSNFLHYIWLRNKVAFIIMLKKRNYLIYRRYSFFLPFDLMSIVTNQTVMEFNTNNDLYFREKSFFIFLYHKIQEIIINKFAICGFAVTNEIKQMQKNKIRKRTVVCSNSIILPKRRMKFNRNWKRVRIAFLISEDFSWNGLTKLYNLARNLPLYDFYVIGPIKETKKLENIFFLGPIYGQELSETLNKMDFGLANLNMEKIGLSEFAPLKNRKYLEIGLPIISVYQDSGLKKSDNFIHILPEDIFLPNFSEISQKKLDAYVKYWKGKRVSLKEIKHLSSSEIERLRVDHIVQFHHK